MNRIRGMRLAFGDRTQANWINEMKEPELIADKYGRDDSERYLQRKMPEIMTRKNFNHENLRWQCPLWRFYWRDPSNTLWARYLAKYEDINELEFKSSHDPLKFYENLSLESVNPHQANLFNTNK